MCVFCRATNFLNKWKQLFYRIVSRLTWSSERQWETSWSLSPTRLSESLWVKIVLSSRSRIKRTASLRIRSEVFRELSALKIYISCSSNVVMKSYFTLWAYFHYPLMYILPIVMIHVRSLPICRRKLVWSCCHGRRSSVSTPSIPSHWAWHCHIRFVAAVTTTCMNLRIVNYVPK